MSAKVYAPPESVPAPSMDDYYVNDRFSIEAMREADEGYLARLRAWLAEHGYRSPLAGGVVRWPFADGHAQYMVMSLRPLALIHLPLGDAWRMDVIFERGLTAADIRQQVERQRRLAEIFKRK